MGHSRADSFQYQYFLSLSHSRQNHFLCVSKVLSSNLPTVDDTFDEISSVKKEHFKFDSTRIDVTEKTKKLSKIVFILDTGNMFQNYIVTQ